MCVQTPFKPNHSCSDHGSVAVAQGGSGALCGGSFSFVLARWSVVGGVGVVSFLLALNPAGLVGRHLLA